MLNICLQLYRYVNSALGFVSHEGNHCALTESESLNVLLRDLNIPYRSFERVIYQNRYLDNRFSSFHVHWLRLSPC